MMTSQFYVLVEWNRTGQTQRTWSGPYTRERAEHVRDSEMSGTALPGWSRRVIIVEDTE